MNEQKLDERQARQGDVLLVRTADSAQVAPADKPVVLKLGEATGHKHQFMAESRVSYLGNTAPVLVGAPSLLRHDEHTEAPVREGIYDMPNQVEFTDEQDVRVVAD